MTPLLSGSSKGNLQHSSIQQLDSAGEPALLIDVLLLAVAAGMPLRCSLAFVLHRGSQLRTPVLAVCGYIARHRRAPLTSGAPVQGTGRWPASEPAPHALHCNVCDEQCAATTPVHATPVYVQN